MTPANLAVLKNGRAKAVRFSTLVALCEALECQPGDLLRYEPEDTAETSGEPAEGSGASGERSEARAESPAGVPHGARR